MEPLRGLSSHDRDIRYKPPRRHDQMIPGESIGWTEFDVLAQDAATAAHVAMWLRDALPDAHLRSEPAAAASEDAARPHLLHCSARIGEHTGEQTRALLEDALCRLAVVGESGRALVVFLRPAGASQLRAA